MNTAASNEAELGVVLKMARKVKDPTTKGRDRRIIRSLIVHSQDFVEIEARNVPAVVGGSGLLGGFTDTEISGANVKAGQHRELTKWVDDGAGGPEARKPRCSRGCPPQKLTGCKCKHDKKLKGCADAAAMLRGHPNPSRRELPV